MARINLAGHWKFRRFVRAIEALAPDQLTAATPLARGILELLWEAGYTAVSDYVGRPEEIAHTVHWRGDPAMLVAFLVDAGFLDADVPGEYRIHDLWENAPRYAQLRRTRKLVGQTSDNVGQTSDKRRTTDESTSSVVCRPTQSSPVQGERKSSAAHASRFPDQDDRPDPRQIAALGYELIRQGRRFTSEADAKGALKDLAVRYGIPYDATSITGGLDALKHAHAPLFVSNEDGLPMHDH